MCKLNGYQYPFSMFLGVYLLSSICLLLVTPLVAEPASTEKIHLPASKKLIVSTKGGLVSVKATEAPLKDVIEQIGQALGIAVEAQIGSEEMVTVEFHDLSLEQSIKRLSGNYAYTTSRSGSKTKKLFIFPKGEAAPLNHSVAETEKNKAGRPASRAEPFKFEFNPAEYTQTD